MTRFAAIDEFCSELGEIDADMPDVGICLPLLYHLGVDPKPLAGTTLDSGKTIGELYEDQGAGDVRAAAYAICNAGASEELVVTGLLDCLLRHYEAAEYHDWAGYRSMDPASAEVRRREYGEIVEKLRPLRLNRFGRRYWLGLEHGRTARRPTR